MPEGKPPGAANAFSSPAGTGGGCSDPQCCALFPALPASAPPCLEYTGGVNVFWGGYSEVGAALRIRPNLREAELRVLDFDFALSLIDSSALQEAQQPS